MYDNWSVIIFVVNIIDSELEMTLTAVRTWCNKCSVKDNYRHLYTLEKLSKRLDDIQGRTVPGANTICLLHFARDFNNHINKVSGISYHWDVSWKCKNLWLVCKLHARCQQI